MSSLFSLQGGPACACSQRLGGGAASRAAGAAPCRLGASSCRRSAGAPRGAVRKAWSTRSRAALQVQAFSLARSLGIPSGPHSWLPGLLPDFGLTRRQAVLDAFFRISDGGPALDAEARCSWRGRASKLGLSTSAQHPLRTTWLPAAQPHLCPTSAPPSTPAAVRSAAGARLPLDRDRAAGGPAHAHALQSRRETCFSPTHNSSSSRGATGALR